LEWRQLYTEGLNDLYTSPNIIRMIKSRRMRWTGNVARMGDRPVAYKILVGNPEGKRPGVDGRKLWSWIFRKWDVVNGMG
jgi:hypothetical protein